ncbi:LuxR C-terminal-related transcriptional regulator [Colwellia sp. 4_MG-2023]|uniref:helix-turn-helix transcriptional regulator n=1 Tax=unclassified Colwellia TaxID=196834 RepID=UPI001C0860A4|nr:MULTISPECIES: LuxR C-terminal-related transcriptional regulator [unclassified Colwellia]MBU2923710.1 LuxR C-terminal-related transcriptional regulator [Colwellia sp. C2M11]MDO6505767.1 LuxR C-terminal-related transcriptional regulator [Colwellia sp. 5_MG-2023]MDO6554448.1 LuxR C-terminal-related transcriptional regulator [Colwellia sp. 4_MG-2023]MDO6652190.1 LuxR C-terminal-related transcriptional regulator [Colwellia sp. 3_MG-2023]MDO6664641.1 LuxR C-terminal-related transcriptional regula
MRNILITIMLITIMVLNFFDVLFDISMGAPSWHIISESLIVIVSGIGAILLIKDINEKISNISTLKKALMVSDDKLKNISDEMKNARYEYGVVIHNQFNEWSLTPSEKEVGMLLLKGLSFKEISAVRNTKEKTVRQQASILYSKANVEGRHEFSAWFLEDFI